MAHEFLEDAVSILGDLIAFESVSQQTNLDMIADPDDPRDLFGMIQRAGVPSPTIADV